MGGGESIKSFLKSSLFIYFSITFMKKLTVYSIFSMMVSLMWSQSISINDDGSLPDNSAILDVQAIDKGVLLPRMTTFQRDSIRNPAQGLIIYDLFDRGYWYFDSTDWEPMAGSKPNCISDQDRDTQIQVEESPDEDLIRMDIAGNERLLLTPSTLFVEGNFVSGANSSGAGSNFFVAGGSENEALGNESFVGGGKFNIAGGIQSAVIGGQDNQSYAFDGFIGGGLINFVGFDASQAFIGGGAQNSALGESSGIVGGRDNQTEGNLSFIGGGIRNVAPSYAEAVFGTFPTSYSPASTTSISSTDRLFNIGNGTSTSNRSDAFTVRKNGNIGINKGTPGSLLDIFNDDKTPLSIYINHQVTPISTGTQFGLFVNMVKNNTASPSSVIGNYSYATSNGGASYAILGTSISTSTSSNPAYGVRAIAENDFGTGVGYAVYATINSSSSTGAKYAGYFAGNVFTTGSYLPSDARLKSALQPSESVLDKVMHLQIANYSYLHEQYPGLNLPTGNRTGFVAQNVATLMPELVNQATQPATTKEEEEAGMPQAEAVHFQAVDYAGMVPYLTKAMQEQQAMIEQQQQLIEAMQAEMTALKAQINK